MTRIRTRIRFPLKQIPQNAKRSFNASHSEFYWLLEAKVDIDRRRDIRVNQVLQVLFSIREKANGEGYGGAVDPIMRKYWL